MQLTAKKPWKRIRPAQAKLVARPRESRGPEKIDSEELQALVEDEDTR